MNNPQIYLGAKQIDINRTPEFPNKNKNLSNQWETPLELSYYKLLHPPNEFGGYSKVTLLEFFSRPYLKAGKYSTKKRTNKLVLFFLLSVF